MENKKFILLIPLILLILLGCENKEEVYNGNHITYSFDFNSDVKNVLDVYMPEDAESLAKTSIIEDTSPILEHRYLYEKYGPFGDDTKLYERSEIEKVNNFTHITLSSTVGLNEIENLEFFKRCFAYSSIANEEDYVSIVLSGEFRCLYGDKAIIKFSGRNIASSNIKDIKNGVYTLEIDNMNFDDEITLTVSKNTEKIKGNNIMRNFYIIIGVILLIIISVVLIIRNKLKDVI